MLDSESVSGMAKNSLFVIGRNIYPAACGTSTQAMNFIRNFPEVTRHFDPARRKAILDGMLFETFFDSHGNLRERIKSGYFNELFELDGHPQLKASFISSPRLLPPHELTFTFCPEKATNWR
jgi:hypothetical protein